MSKTLTVVVGSTNPVKVNAAKATLQRAFADADIEVHGLDAPSGVAAQPMTEAQTLQGARNRVSFCQQTQAADIYVAFEGGVDEFEYGVATFAYVVVACADQISVGRTADLPLPRQFYQDLQAGRELGDVLDERFNTSNVKQQGGAIGLLTNHFESRESAYQQALMLALAPILHAEWF